jgi:hypothetical protein
LIKLELDSWKLESKEIKQVYKLASKLMVSPRHLCLLS